MSSIPTNVSKSVRDLNPHIYPPDSFAAQEQRALAKFKFDPKKLKVEYGTAIGDPRAKIKITADKPLRLVITGQIRGGKNNMGVSRTGHHFPKKNWAKWRDAAVQQVQAQIPTGYPPFTEPVNVRLEYFSQDKRRRDMPAIIDSIWHVLERSGVVEDDYLLWISSSIRGYDKDNPRTILTFNV